MAEVSRNLDDQDEVKVLFILGKGRSGSTMLGNVLDTAAGVFNAGEFRRFWGWGLLDGYLCACGVPVPECSLWREVLVRLRDTGPAPDVERMAELTRKVMSWRNVHHLVGDPQRALRRWPGAEEWVDVMVRVYRAIAEVTGTRVVVDTTKMPVNPLLLGAAPGMRLHALQVVRDPRAVAYSWKRRKVWRDRPRHEEMPRYGSAQTAVGWVVRNRTTERLLRRLPSDRSALVRYEDLVAAPEAWTREVLRLVGSGEADVPFGEGGTVELVSNHAVGGNPDRVGRRRVAIKGDVEWQRGSGAFERAAVTLLTFPFLRRYGYPVRTGSADGPSVDASTGSE